MNGSAQTIALIESAFTEDLPEGDISAALLSDGATAIDARVVARQNGVLAGLAILPAILDVSGRRLSARLELVEDTTTNAGASARTIIDGSPLTSGACVATIRGPKSAVLSTERTLLNFLGRMSGVATNTRRFVDAARAASPHVAVLDTRKTIPGWRELDKYAVRCGGGDNHRDNLSDAVLIKDNHIASVAIDRLANSLRQMLKETLPEATRNLGLSQPLKFIEIEVDSLEQLREVLKVDGVDIVLLDNFTLEDLRAAVRLRDEAGVAGRIALEASGGVTLETIGPIAATGVERISVGALTHSATNFDFGLDREV